MTLALQGELNSLSVLVYQLMALRLITAAILHLETEITFNFDSFNKKRRLCFSCAGN